MTPDIACFIMTHEQRSEYSPDRVKIDSVSLPNELIISKVRVFVWYVLPGTNERLFVCHLVLARFGFGIWLAGIRGNF